MTRRTLNIRRQINRALAEQDAAARCQHCKVVLPDQVYIDFGGEAQFCSAACRDTEADVRAQIDRAELSR